jgi:hypothetical protein
MELEVIKHFMTSDRLLTNYNRFSENIQFGINIAASYFILCYIFFEQTWQDNLKKDIPFYIVFWKILVTQLAMVKTRNS